MALSFEEILNEARALSPTARGILSDLLAEDYDPAKEAERVKTVRELAGKFAHLKTSSDEFCARKVEDLRFEEHSDR